MHERECKHLAPNPKSSYHQLFVRAVRIRADTFYGMTVDGAEEDHLAAEQVAVECNPPLEAVAYCAADPPTVRQDYAAEEPIMESSVMNGTE
jgi:hypothetical protein